VQLPVSRLVMGCDNQTFLPHGAVMWDDFFERGGNAFDCAFVYGGGNCERTLGQWVKNRGVRKQVVILDKGAHTPMCFPDKLTEQLHISLDRLQMDYLDIYMMHRDNPDVPVGEFVEVMNEHKRAGRMRAFGVSNWTLERIQAFNEYAKQKRLTGLAAVSNNLSLARMVEAPWAGCLSSSDAKNREYFTKTQMVLMPWSSQARGFFTDRAQPDDVSDAELVRCWYADDNFQRQARAKELAKKYGVTPVTIAAAYVLCQPFPTFALIGPRQLSETRTSFDGLKIQLTPQEVKWLNLE
jgi:aryl-alcohol dehydrogenase-like predicted oxidoreductase